MTDWLRRGAFLALAFAGSAQALQITLPSSSEPETINIQGPYSVAWVHSFIGVGVGLPENGGGNLCSSLAKESCAVNGSLAIQKQDNFVNGVAGSTAPGPLFSVGQTFIVDTAAPYSPDLPVGYPDNPFLGGNSDGYWRYSDAPSFVTAWATKGGSDGYTVFYLVRDDELVLIEEVLKVPGYSGIEAPINTWLPFGTFKLGDPITSADLSNIIFFNSREPTNPPQGAPEPGTLLLLGAGLAGLGALRWRRSS